MLSAVRSSHFWLIRNLFVFRNDEVLKKEAQKDLERELLNQGEDSERMGCVESAIYFVENLYFGKIPTYVKFIYSEKATNFCEISTVDLSYVVCTSQIYGGDFRKL